MINVLIVEDSPVVKDFLVHVLSDSDIKVIGTAGNGLEALEFVKKTKPDLITMDIYMPRMNGLEATRRIMETSPVPIVIVSGNWDPNEVQTTFDALDAGALAVVQRPRGLGHADYDSSVAELVRTVKLMSEVKVVRRWPRTRPKSRQKDTALLPASEEVKVVAIGASAGGPPALQKILNGLPGSFPVAVLIVQHMAAGFLPGMMEWLRETSGIPLGIAVDGERALPGHAYFAPDGFHMGIGKNGIINLSEEEYEHGARPSVSYLFRSVARNYGGKAIGVILTGMGRDGAAELKLLKENGCITIVQDKDSSAVYGMPAAARELDAAVYELSPAQIPPALIELTNKETDT